MTPERLQEIERDLDFGAAPDQICLMAKELAEEVRRLQEEAARWKMFALDAGYQA